MDVSAYRIGMYMLVYSYAVGLLAVVVYVVVRGERARARRSCVRHHNCSEKHGISTCGRCSCAYCATDGCK